MLPAEFSLCSYALDLAADGAYDALPGVQPDADLAHVKRRTSSEYFFTLSCIRIAA